MGESIRSDEMRVDFVCGLKVELIEFVRGL